MSARKGFGDRRDAHARIQIDGTITTNLCRPVASRPEQFLIDHDSIASGQVVVSSVVMLVIPRGLAGLLG